MASLLPRGIPSPQASKPPSDLPSPSDDLNLTVQKLLTTNSGLEGKVKELEGDKKHFQSKLEEYIRYDREEGGSHDKLATSKLEKQLSELIAEKADLQFQLGKEREQGGTYSLKHVSDREQHAYISDREQRAILLQRLNELQASSRSSQDYYTRQIDMLKVENTRLREESEHLRKTHYADWRNAGRERPPSWELARSSRGSYTEGYSSLPESLSSGSTGQSGVAKLPDVASLQLSSKPSPSADVASIAAELKKTKRQLEKYITANIELDQKLKDAKLELQKFAEGRRDWDVGSRMDLERLRSENAQLRSQLDRAMSESNRLRSLVGRRY